jgi:hypothetical protein
MDRELKLKNVKTWIARVLIGLVLLDNFQAAIIFLIFPQRISSGFELTGVAGNAAIQGIGLLFLMWCVPYFIATLNPAKHKISFIESIIMQAIALVGESVLLALLPTKLPVLAASVQRFILFDGIGLLLLLIAKAVLWIPRRSA